VSERERAAVLPVERLAEADRPLVDAFDTTVALFNVGGRLFALNNSCPHRGGPLCHGIVSGAPLPAAPHQYVWGLEDQVLTCPWHGWEFDLTTGEALFDRRVAVASYDVAIEDGEIVLYARN
jgi:3-phenylpropionate/trans-cinnamate dioxygenase ferredoxin subunit